MKSTQSNRICYKSVSYAKIYTSEHIKLSLHLLRSPQGNCRAEVVCIIIIFHRKRVDSGTSHCVSHCGDHVDSSFGCHAEDVNIVDRALNIDHILLAVVCCHTRLAVVVEEGVQASSHDEDVLRVNDTQTPCHVDAIVSDTGELRIAALNGERSWCGWILLEVRGLRLYDRHVDIIGAAELVIVQNGVFRSSAVHPNWSLGLDQNTTSIVDVDLTMIGEVEFVVRRPEPAVLNVNRRGLASVEHEVGAFASWVSTVGDSRVLDASVGLEFSAGAPTNTRMDIPKAISTRRRSSRVPLQE